MKTILEQIKDLENTRAAKAAQMRNVMQKSIDEGRSTDDAEGEEVDTLEVEVKRLDKDLERLRKLEKLNVEQAVAADGTSSKAASESRAGKVAESGNAITVKSNVPKGMAFTRYAIAKMATKGDTMAAIEYAKHRWHDSTPEVEMLLKAAVAAGTTTDATWAGPLAPLRPLLNEFIDLLRPATIIGRIPNLHQVPFNVSIAAQTGGGSYGWVGQGKPKPLTKAAFGTVSLGIAKAAGIIVMTEELIRVSTPSAEATIQNEMVKGIGAFLDSQFINPAVAAVAGVNPSSITNGTTAITSAGTTPANARTDLAALVGAFVTANLSTATAVFVMSEANAFSLGLALNSLGQPLFPGLGANGGTLLGIPVITSQSAGNNVVLLSAENILLADEGGVEVDVSREASLDMQDTPDDPTVATTVMVNLWQRNLVGMRAERFINWARAQPSAVKYTVQSYTLS